MAMSFELIVTPVPIHMQSDHPRGENSDQFLFWNCQSEFGLILFAVHFMSGKVFCFSFFIQVGFESS